MLEMGSTYHSIFGLLGPESNISDGIVRGEGLGSLRDDLLSRHTGGIGYP